jgi:hypothetical protein
MRHHRQRHTSTDRTLFIFGVSFNPVTTKWSVFSEDTMSTLSEHITEEKAHAACRRYEPAAWRRLMARPLAYLAHRAI